MCVFRKQATKDAQQLQRIEIKDLAKQLDEAKQSKVKLINSYSTELSRLREHIERLQNALNQNAVVLRFNNFALKF